MTAALPHCEPFVTVLIRSFKRRQTLLELLGRLLYFHRIVAHYCPLRFWLLYPLFLIWILARLLSWVWEPDNRHIGPLERVSASLTAVAAFPWLVVRRGWFAPVRGLRRVRSIPRPA